MRILVADDDLVSRLKIELILKKMGHEIVSCSSGTEVLGHLFAGDLPQLLFLDWMMPGHSGIEVSQKIRENQNLDYTYIVLVTTKRDRDDVIEGLRMGANDYILKPVEMEEFQTRLKVGIQMIEIHNLVQKQKLSMIASAKMLVLGEMAGGMAHQVNTPLSIISMIAQQLINSLKQGLIEEKNSNKEKIEKQLQTILQNVTRIAHIIQGLILFSNSDSSEQPQTIEVKSFFSRLLTFCSEKIKIKGIKLTLSEHDSEAYFFGAEMQICQAFLNLIENSIYALEGKSNKCIEIDFHDDFKNVLFSITDNGSGIVSEHQEKIMHPFFTTKPVGQGTGLGLSIAKGIIDAHGGYLKLDTSSFQTRFIISLPKQATKIKAS